jgi:hypothetical protein
VDKEELRTDKAVEVPRKEQYDLIAELLELTPIFSTQEQEISRKKKPSDNIMPPVENNTMVNRILLINRLYWNKSIQTLIVLLELFYGRFVTSACRTRVTEINKS